MKSTVALGNVLDPDVLRTLSRRNCDILVTADSIVELMTMLKPGDNLVPFPDSFPHFLQLLHSTDIIGLDLALNVMKL